jgi:hypothetical protein
MKLQRGCRTISGKSYSRACPLSRAFENPDGFLTMKDFKRAVNAEMQAIQKMKPID